MDIGKLFRDAWGLFAKDIGPLVVGMLIASIVPAVAAVVIAATTIGASISGLEVNAQGDVTGVETMNWAVLIVGAVAIVVVTVFLSVPLYVGILSGVFRRVREGREMAYGDAFSGFALFGRAIWATVLLGLIFAAITAVPTAIIVAGAVAESGVVAGLGALVLVAALVAYVYLGICWVYVFPVIVDRDLGVTAAMGESRRLVHGTGWWWTFLVLLLLQLLVGAVSFALGLIPFAGAVATIVLYPFVLTYVVAMYFQARGEGHLIDAVLGWPRKVPAGPPAYSTTAAPYGTPPAPPVPSAPPPPSAPPEVPTQLADQGQAYVPTPPPLTPQPLRADEKGGVQDPAPQTAVTQPVAPESPPQPTPPAPPSPPEPPALGPQA